VAAAKATPDAVTYASGGVGSSAHLAAELFARRAGIKLIHVPYRGGAPAIQSLLAGDVSLLWDTPQPATRGYIEQGSLRALAVMASARLPAYPDIAAIGEAGLGDDLAVQAWQGVLVRAGTPPEPIDTLYQTIVRAMAEPEARTRIAALAVEPMATSPAEFAAFFRA
jgi:tripartite-type tricarboxylate transporter receptor subunit TctC